MLQISKQGMEESSTYRIHILETDVQNVNAKYEWITLSFNLPVEFIILTSVIYVLQPPTAILSLVPTTVYITSN